MFTILNSKTVYVGFSVLTVGQELKPCSEWPRPLELIVLREALEYSCSFDRICVSEISAETEVANNA